MPFTPEATKKVAEALYGENAAIGDGALLEMFMKFLQDFLGSCPFGARGAHRKMNSPFAFIRNSARNTLEIRAYNWCGDKEQAAWFTEAGMRLGESSSAQEFVDFANMKA